MRSEVEVWRWRCGGGVVVVVWGSVHLEGVARQRELVLRERQRLAGGDAELPLDEVDARHHLGHRVLDLQDEEGGAGSE